MTTLLLDRSYLYLDFLAFQGYQIGLISIQGVNDYLGVDYFSGKYGVHLVLVLRSCSAMTLTPG
jgi:hypothetical protein